MTRKYSKICLGCGEEFKGGALAKTCKPSCRVFLKRLLDVGKTSPYWYLAVSAEKKTHLRVLDKPKEVAKKDIEVKSEKQQEVKEVVIPKVEQKAELTKEQKSVRIAELKQKIISLNREQCPLDKHPKMWKLTQEVKVSEIEDEIKYLEK